MQTATSTTSRMEFYRGIYDRMYTFGYHSKPDYSHAKVLCESVRRTYAPKSVLDVGCSLGWSLEYFAMHGVPAVGVDVSSVAVTKARRLGRDARLASATDLPFADRQFDMVLSTDCLEHMRPEDAPFAVRELARVADRYLAIKVNPRVDRNRWWKWVARTNLHLTIVPVSQWLDWFAAEGFEVVSADDAREEYVLVRRALASSYKLEPRG